MPPEHPTAGPLLIEVTVTVRVYSRSHGHAVIEVQDRLTREQDPCALQIIETRQKAVKQ